jgi:diguanylate cyclase (GGDEF)-like protein
MMIAPSPDPNMPRTPSSSRPKQAVAPARAWPDAEVVASLSDAADVAEWMLRFEHALARYLPGTEAKLQRAPTLEVQAADAVTSRPRGALAFPLLDADDHALGTLVVKPPQGSLGRHGKALAAGIHVLLPLLDRRLALEHYRSRAGIADLLLDLSYILLFEEDIDVMLHGIVAYLRERFGLSLATIALMEADGRNLVLRAYAGSSRVDLRPGVIWPAERGLTGRALRQRGTVFVADVHADPDYVEGNALTRAELVVPIKHAGGLLGFINLESPAAESFSIDARAVLELLADQIGGVLHLHLLRQRLQEVHSAAQAVLAELHTVNDKLNRANRKLERLSSQDALTGASNRRGFERALRLAWRAARVNGSRVALLLLDVDFFKAYNDHYGHPAGDACLRAIGDIVRGSLRGTDSVFARYGGEEFAVVLPGADIPAASLVAERIRAAIENRRIPHAHSAVSAQVTVSVGVASMSPAAATTTRVLVAAADAALYRAKQAGRNRVIVAPAEAATQVM